ncbi:MAG: glycoside hydrolase [Flavobacteriales bacterium]|nr:MAG: glycoside hydrolase [Flavobacteriales bacterium]
MAKKGRRKTKKNRGCTFVLFFCLILILILGGVGFKYRHQIAYYYSIYFQPFRQLKLSNSAFETYRMNKIIDKHSDKVFGIDISHYQKRRQFKWDSLQIKQQEVPIHFVLMRATMGNSSKDGNFKYFWKKTKKNNYIRGAYHYYRPDEDPKRQANNFLKTIRLQKGDLRPVLDIEKLPHLEDESELIKNLKIWLNLVEKKYGVKPIIYTYYHFYKDYLQHDIKGYPIWMANYNDVPQPIPDNQWDFWQFSEKGIIKGINTKVDLNVFNGNLKDLEKFRLK